MAVFAEIEDLFPEMGYTKHTEPRNCGLCVHGEVSNAGARIPGYTCLLMEAKGEELGYPKKVGGSYVYASGQVSRHHGTCKLFKNWHDAKQEAAAEEVRGAGI